MDVIGVISKVRDLVLPSNIIRNIRSRLSRISPFFSFSYTNPLPVEIWIIILEMAVDGTIEPKPPAGISFSNFPQYYYNWNPYHSRDIKDEWTHIRLVCRTWAQILDRCRTPHLNVGSAYDLMATVHTRSIWMKDTYLCGGPSHPQLSFSPHNVEFFTATRNITTISIGSPYRENHNNDADKLFFADFIFNHSNYFPNVSTFAFCPRGHVKPEFNFWARLEKALPRLVSLRMESEYTHIPVSVLQPNSALSHYVNLPHLKIFIVGLQTIPRCSFPSLKHLAFPYAISLDSRWFKEDSYLQLLQDHGYNLESLILPGTPYIPPSILETFWTILPNLKHLAASHWIIRVIHPPRSDSIIPLERLTLVDVQPQHQELSYFLSYLSTPPGNPILVSNPSLIGQLRFPALRYIAFDRWQVSLVAMFGLRRQYGRVDVEYVDIGPIDRPMGVVRENTMQMLWNLGCISVFTQPYSRFISPVALN